MADSVLFIGWNEPKQGREGIAGELFGSTVAFYQAKVEDGTLESFEPVFLSRHGGDMNGFFLLRGEGAKLDAFRRSDEFLDWQVKAMHCLSGFGVIDGFVGTKIPEMMQRWTASIPS